MKKREKVKKKTKFQTTIRIKSPNFCDLRYNRRQQGKMIKIRAKQMPPTDI